MSEELVQINVKNKPASSIRIVLVLSLIAAICGALIALAVQMTKQAILNNQAEGVRQAVLSVIPSTDQIVSFTADKDGIFHVAKAEDKEKLYYASYDKDGSLQGVAFMGEGAGYADKIKILFGYDVEDKTLLGIKVTESKETPGLGERITSDADFLANFKNMSLQQFSFEGAHEIEAVKGEKTQPWQISAIAGATVSSRAVAKILTNSGKEAVPLIEKNIEVLRKGVKK